MPGETGPLPDVGGGIPDPWDHSPMSTQESDLTGHELVGPDILDDDEKDLVADALETDSMEGQSAEEAAMHIVEP